MTNEELLISGYSYSEGLAPVVDKNAKVLILGTLPGADSLESGFYYRKKNNRLWTVLCEITDDYDLNPKEISSCVEFLHRNGIALWDVFHSGYRKRSRDGVKNGLPNDLNGFLEQYQNIRAIVLAGKDAQKSFSKFYTNISIDILNVPSTSGVNGHWKKTKFLWNDLKKYIE